MAFVSSPSSTNEVNTTYGVSTANTQVSPASTQVSTASTQVSTANLSDDTVYAFLASQPNGSQLVYEDLEQIHEDDIEEMDLKWQLALLSMRTRRNRNQDSSRRTVNVEETSSKAMVAIDGAGFDWSYMADDEVPTNMALMAFSDSEFNKSEFNLATYKRGLASVEEQLVFYKKNEPSKSVSEDISNEVRKSPNAPLVEELVLDDKLEKKTIFPTVAKIEFNSRNLMEDMLPLGEEPKEGKLLMCDKKKSVLFTDTGCFVLSPDFKLNDESQVLLKVPRKNSMYSVDMKNIVPKEYLTCLVAKATLDESML
ncbi:hypothetical protein Tco_0953974 [Tanacetum coccineum]|uniref:Uncharacterized protein n=1 Tax=Tanacetum coccineum TaxID=301880 RepID=A0ABQ5E2F2_9ASTR